MFPDRRRLRRSNLVDARLVGLVVGLATLLTTAPAVAQQAAGGNVLPPDRRTMTALRLNADEQIALDGVLNEGAWQRAVPASDFTQQDPILGGTPTERTEVRILFDGERLYMGVTCFDSEPGLLLGNTMKRDAFLSADDRFMWTLDTFLDQQTGYFFEMNPSGLMADSLMGAGSTDRAWDGIWNARVRKSDIGWTIEIEIPFRTLNFDPDALAWGINFQRTIRRKNEENLWTGHERNQGLRRMANAGLLVGIGDVTQGHGLDIKPYVASTTFDAPGGNPATSLDTSADVGFDLVYNLTPDLRANLTVNTDFAQTEVDQRLVNLTRFPLFFPEKRDFFLDGSTFFRPEQMSGLVQPFFSRRIGLGDDGAPQRIDLGVKLTGRVGGQDVGLLQVRTAGENDLLGEDFTVFRLKRRISTQSYVGTFLSRRHTRGPQAPEDLHTAGFDVHLETSTFRGSDNLEVSGFFLWATNPLDTGDNLSYGAQIAYPNDLWNGRMSFTEVQANHRPALGFVGRRGFRDYDSMLQFGPRPTNHPWIRQLRFGVRSIIKTGMDNRQLTRAIDITAFRAELHSQETFEVHVLPGYERLERNFEISDGVVLPTGREYTFTRYRFQASTADRRILATRSSVEFGKFFSGDRREVIVNVSVRPRPGVLVNLQSEWNRVDLPEGQFNTRVYRVVADTQFSPWTYLVNNIQFDSVSANIGWQSRLRWILTPGNDLYIVYTQNWHDDAVANRFVTLERRGAAKFVYTYRY
jgi:hypothetical protein